MCPIWPITHRQVFDILDRAKATTFEPTLQFVSHDLGEAICSMRVPGSARSIPKQIGLRSPLGSLYPVNDGKRPMEAVDRVVAQFYAEFVEGEGLFEVEALELSHCLEQFRKSVPIAGSHLEPAGLVIPKPHGDRRVAGSLPERREDLGLDEVDLLGELDVVLEFPRVATDLLIVLGDLREVADIAIQNDLVPSAFLGNTKKDSVGFGVHVAAVNVRTDQIPQPVALVSSFHLGRGERSLDTDSSRYTKTHPDTHS